MAEIFHGAPRDLEEVGQRCLMYGLLESVGRTSKSASAAS